MTTRWITLEIYVDEDQADFPDKYADLAHGIWFIAKAALPSGGFTVLHDETDRGRRLQRHYTDRGNDIPWK